jgi:hypothetical protein
LTSMVVVLLVSGATTASATASCRFGSKLGVKAL